MQLNLFLKLRYPNGFNLKDCLDDEELRSFFPEDYLPPIYRNLTSDEKPFLKVTQRMKTNGDFQAAYYIYLRQTGKIANYPEADYVQLPPNLDKGYIAKFTLPISARTQNNLELDYFIPLISVAYETVSDIRGDTKKGVILSSEGLLFSPLDPRNVQDVVFDDMVLNWIDHREDLFELFGIR